MIILGYQGDGEGRPSIYRGRATPDVPISRFAEVGTLPLELSQEPEADSHSQGGRGWRRSSRNSLLTLERLQGLGFGMLVAPGQVEAADETAASHSTTHTSWWRLVALTLASLGTPSVVGAASEPNGNASCMGLELASISPPGSSDEVPGGAPQFTGEVKGLAARARPATGCPVQLHRPPARRFARGMRRGTRGLVRRRI